MITLKRLAEEFEKGLNEQLPNDEIRFKIWAHAGEYKPPLREGNKVAYNIVGNLTSSTSANDANDLAMGVNGLSLEFSVPLQQPRTNASQTTEELAKINDEQYPFVTYIVNAINGCFQRAKTLVMTDADGVEFTVAYQAGTAVSGTVDLSSLIGNAVSVSVYIEVYFVEGGINSKNLIVYFDNSPVPYIAVRHGRTPVVDGDIYSGKLVSKNLITSSAFALDLDYPANGDILTKASVDYLLSGEPNVAHFVEVVFGAAGKKLFLMTLNTLQTSAQGISIAGVSASLMEVVENIDAINIPDGYQVGRFELANSQINGLSFTLSEECNAFIAGNAVKLSGAVNVGLTPSAIESDEGKYYVYLITDKTVEVSNASAPFTVL